MRQVHRLLGNPDARTILFLAMWPFVFFFPVSLGQGLWLGTDTLRTYLPLGVELSRALSQARLPLWTPRLYTGFPLLADGQIGALYPVNSFLYRLLPAYLALPYGMLLHLAWAACGMYALARAWKIGPAGALLAGLVYSFSGFFFTRLMHTTIILTAAWLPWLIFLQDQFQRAQMEKRRIAAIWFFSSTLAVAAQLLAGFPQIAFLNSLAFVVIGFCGRILWNKSDVQVEPRIIAKAVAQSAAWAALPVILGGGIAGIQLLPTAELAGYSLRGGTTSQGFVTSYSLPPAYLGQFIYPFAQGEPSEENNEYLAYFGLAPLALAVLVPFVRRNRLTIFLSLFALAALSLALGELNPIYQLLYRLPGFGLFRVPSRYLYLFVFSAAMLAAVGLEELARRLQPADKTVRWIAPMALSTLVVLVLTYTQPLEFWMRIWQALPWLLGLAIAAILWLAWSRRIARDSLVAFALGLTLFDLSSYAPAFLTTIAPIVPASGTVTPPRSLQALDGAGQDRFFTDESIFPSYPALRGSLFPNTALIYGQSGAQAYSSLALGRHEAYFINPSATMLNLANVRYFMVPLEPRSQTQSLTPYNTLYLDIVNDPPKIPPTAAVAVNVASFTEQGGGLAVGTEVGEINVKYADESISTFPLRVGIETADWDSAQKNTDVAARVAHSFPAFWRSIGHPFDGHTFLAQFSIAPPGQTRDIIGISARVIDSQSRLAFESVSLVDDKGHAVSLATLARKNNFRLAFLSDTVAAWENLDVLPRAFVVHRAEVVDDNTTFARLKEQQVDIAQEVLLSEGTPLEPSSGSALDDEVQITRYEPESVTLSTKTSRPGYLLLADSWYPGWSASVDGKPTQIDRADFLFRAVPIDQGQHTVSFAYQPSSLRLGAALSAASLLLTGIISVIIRRRFASSR